MRAASYRVTDNQFALAVGCQKHELIAILGERLGLGSLAADKAPQFVNLDKLSLYVQHFLIKHLGAMLASRFEDIQDRAFIKTAQAGAGAYPDPFTEEVDNLRGLGEVGPHTIKRLSVA